MNKDRAIITQVAAKIAADLVLKAENVETTLSNWELAFNYVNDKLQDATGMKAEANMENAINTFNAAVTTNTGFDGPKPALAKGAIKVAGTQHGDLPGWLVAACQKSGITKVWDNRDTAVGTRRPWFKQADAPEGAEPAAFWPPKGN